MKPVKVKTVQVKAGPMKLASAGPVAAGAARHQRDPCPPRSGGDLQRRGRKRRRAPRPRCRLGMPAANMPPQPANHGTGNGVLGVLPGLQPGTGARLARAGAGLCRSGATRPAAGRAAERRRSSRPHRRWSTPAGSSRSAHSKAKAKPSSGSISPAAKASAPAQQGRSLHRAGRRQGQSQRCSAPASPVSSAIQAEAVCRDAEARRHFLHHRSQLIRSFRLKSQSRRRKRRLCCFHRVHKVDRPVRA